MKEVTEVRSDAVPLPLEGEPESFVGQLLRADPLGLRGILDGRGVLVNCVLAIALGAGAFGAGMGVWRGPLQAVYTAVKLPLILLLTAALNGLVNGALAPLLGVALGWRESFRAVLASFAIASLILAGFSPLVLFEVWNLPSMDAVGVDRGAIFNWIQLTQVVAIAFAGLVANLRLRQFVRFVSGSSAAATRVVLAWLAGNLLLGSQLAWILRPFFGQPELAIEFLRPNAFESNFFETLFRGTVYLLRE